MKQIKRGDYFLLPYKGSRLSNLVRAVRMMTSGNWIASYAINGHEGYITLSACSRCPRSVVLRILKRRNLPRLK